MGCRRQDQISRTKHLGRPGLDPDSKLWVPRGRFKCTFLGPLPGTVTPGPGPESACSQATRLRGGAHSERRWSQDKPGTKGKKEDE